MHAVARSLGDDALDGWAVAADAYRALAAGELAEAERLAEKAYWLGRTLHVQGLQGNAFHSWSEALLELGDEGRYARALGARGASVERLADAYAAFRLGDLARAERIARTIAGWQTREGRDAYAVVARCLVRRGQLDEAGAILDRIEAPLTGDGGAPQLARRVIAAGALALLDRHAAACRAGGLGFCELSCAALAVELAPPAEAARRAAALVPHARTRGFARIARELDKR
jgi:tetratricopeptide (TPR) repeat protein